MEKHGQGMDPYPISVDVTSTEADDRCRPPETHRAVSDRPETVCEEANRLTQKERKNNYGPPEQDFARTACMLNAIFAHKFKSDALVTKEDVARIMICLKLSRSIWMQSRDNWVDIAGYAGCGHRCETGEW